MPADKYTSAFMNAIELTNILPVDDFEGASSCYDKVLNAQKEFEHNVSDALILLNEEQQSRLLLQILKNFKLNSFYYIDELDYISKAEKDKYKKMFSIYYNFTDFQWNDGENYVFDEGEDELLISKLCSDQFYHAHHVILAEYQDREGEEKGLSWILDRRQSITRRHEWHELERERKGLPPDTRTLTEKLRSAFLENDEIPDTVESTAHEEIAKTSIAWRYGLSDFAEMLYKLERKGAIDLKSYFEAGGSGTGLVRAIFSLFAFPNDKSAATLNSYLSEIRKNLGNGPLDAGVLKAIGRIRGGRMDDMLPDDSE